MILNVSNERTFASLTVVLSASNCSIELIPSAGLPKNRTWDSMLKNNLVDLVFLRTELRLMSDSGADFVEETNVVGVSK